MNIGDRVRVNENVYGGKENWSGEDGKRVGVSGTLVEIGGFYPYGVQLDGFEELGVDFFLEKELDVI